MLSGVGGGLDGLFLLLSGVHLYYFELDYGLDVRGALFLIAVDVDRGRNGGALLSSGLEVEKSQTRCLFFVRYLCF